jgi:hypothetical protein
VGCDIDSVHSDRLCVLPPNRGNAPSPPHRVHYLSHSFPSITASPPSSSACPVPLPPIQYTLSLSSKKRACKNRLVFMIVLSRHPSTLLATCSNFRRPNYQLQRNERSTTMPVVRLSLPPPLTMPKPIQSRADSADFMKPAHVAGGRK